MFSDGPSFVDYWRKVRARTIRVFERIPADDLEWTHLPGKYTFGDVFRHLPGIERYMYGETVQQRPSAYPGHSVELARGPEAIRAWMDRCHAESLAIFSALTPEDLAVKCRTPAGTPISTRMGVPGAIAGCARTAVASGARAMPPSAASMRRRL